MTGTVTAPSLEDHLKQNKSLLSSVRICAVDPFHAFVPQVVVSSVRGQN